MFKHKLDLLFYPPESSTESPLGKAGILDLLNEDDEKEPPIDLDPFDKGKDKSKEKPEEKEEEKEEEPEKEEDEEDKEDELSEFEDDDETPNEEELELSTPVRKKEILKKYPELFKDFPYLEKAYFREQQYTEIFPTPSDAREAAEKAEALDGFEQSMTNGDVGELFTNVRDTDENGFYKLVDNFLPALAKFDGNAYGTVIGNVIKHAVLTMIEEAKENKDENLEIAAQILYKHTFSTTKWENPKALAKQEDPNKPKDKVAEKEQALIQKEFTRAKDGLNSKVNNSIKATIDANIDSKEQMTPYVKKQAAREAFEEVTKILNTDKRLKQVIDNLWERSHKAEYSQESLNAIRAAVNARIKTVLPAVLKKARIEALKGMGKNVREKVEEDTDTGNKRTSAPQVHRRQQQVSRITNPKEIPKGMTSLEFLNSDD